MSSSRDEMSSLDILKHIKSEFGDGVRNEVLDLTENRVQSVGEATQIMNLLTSKFWDDDSSSRASAWKKTKFWMSKVNQLLEREAFKVLPDDEACTFTEILFFRQAKTWYELKTFVNVKSEFVSVADGNSDDEEEQVKSPSAKRTRLLRPDKRQQGATPNIERLFPSFNEQCFVTDAKRVFYTTFNSPFSADGNSYLIRAKRDVTGAFVVCRGSDRLNEQLGGGPDETYCIGVYLCYERLDGQDYGKFVARLCKAGRFSDLSESSRTTLLGRLEQEPDNAAQPKTVQARLSFRREIWQKATVDLMEST